MNDKNFDKCKVLIEKYFKSLNSKKNKFIPGKSNIPLAIPPYGSEEVIESLESLMSTNVTGGEKVSKFEKKFQQKALKNNLKKTFFQICLSQNAQNVSPR